MCKSYNFLLNITTFLLYHFLPLLYHFLPLSSFIDYEAFQRKKYQLHSKLDSMLKHECGLDVLLSALLIEESEKFENVTKYILEFVEGMEINHYLYIISFRILRSNLFH